MLAGAFEVDVARPAKDDVLGGADARALLDEVQPTAGRVSVDSVVATQVGKAAIIRVRPPEGIAWNLQTDVDDS
jgi:hypothetical protein